MRGDRVWGADLGADWSEPTQWPAMHKTPESSPGLGLCLGFGLSRRNILQAQAGLGLVIAGFRWSDVQAQALLDPIEGVRSKRAPQKSGILSRAIGSEPPNFDPMSNTTSTVIGVVGPCCNGLVRFGEFAPDTIVPDLAQSWELSDDGKAYTFRLRKGVKFHDGKPFTSDDVKFTFDTLRKPPSGTLSIRANLLEAVENIETPDPHTVRFILSRRSPAMLATLAGGWMVVLPKHILEKGPMKDQIVGTGPFRLKEYKRGVSIELTRNPDYHVLGKPHLDGIRTYIIPDQNTALSYFRSGQLDVLGTSTPAVARQWQTQMSKTDYMVGGNTTSCLALHFNAEQKPWDDSRVRLAACLAINRQEALKVLMNGEGFVAGSALPGPWALPPAEVEKIPGYGPYSEANLVQAKKLLAEAGFPSGFKETLLVRRIDLFTPFGIFVKDQLSKINIDITLDVQETASYNQTRNARRYKLEAGGRSYLINDPDAMYGDTVTCDGVLNFSRVCDPKLDQLFTQQSQELDPARRRALTNQMEAVSLANHGSFTMFFRKQYRLYHGHVSGWALHANEDNSSRLEDCWKSQT
jgi:peptide/nickel transport system substrate-binding protein